MQNLKYNDAIEALGLTGKPTQEQIKKAYKGLALKYHPDKNFDKTSEEKEKAKEQFEKIAGAYEALKNKNFQEWQGEATVIPIEVELQGIYQLILLANLILYKNGEHASIIAAFIANFGDPTLAMSVLQYGDKDLLNNDVMVSALLTLQRDSARCSEEQRSELQYNMLKYGGKMLHDELLQPDEITALLKEAIKTTYDQLAILTYFITKEDSLSGKEKLINIQKHLKNNGVDIDSPSEVSKFLGGKLEAGFIEMLKDFLKYVYNAIAVNVFSVKEENTYIRCADVSGWVERIESDKTRASPNFQLILAISN